MMTTMTLSATVSSSSSLPQRTAALLFSVCRRRQHTLHHHRHHRFLSNCRSYYLPSISSSSFPSSSSLSSSENRRFISSSSPVSSSTSTIDHANVVIIGGGIIGTSVAYHLVKLGVQDVVLIERSKLTSGTTWHAAGLMTTYGSMSSTSIDFRTYTKELYSEILPQETGLETGFMDVGFIEVATTPDHYHYFQRVAAFNRFHGIDVEEITPSQIQDHFPLLDMSNILCGFYVNDDGRVNPTDATMALAKGARQYGVTILEDTIVDNVLTTNPTETGQPQRVTGVTTIQQSSSTTPSNGNSNPDSVSDPTVATIHANVVVNCCGMWARQFGERHNVTIPNQAAEHYYLITESLTTADANNNNDGDNDTMTATMTTTTNAFGKPISKWPVVEDPSKCIYIRPEGNGLLVGFFEWDGAPWKQHNIPSNFSFGELEPDWTRMEPYLLDAMDRLSPNVQQNIGIKKFFCGPESFTPDNGPVIGPAPNLINYYVAAGLNSIGILTGGGVGRTLAQWIVNDGIAPSTIDVTGINIDRFQSHQSNIQYRTDRVSESLGNTYRIHYPDHQPKTCRGSKLSPLHDRLVLGQNAYMRDVSGYEAPGFYAPVGIDPNQLVERETFYRPDWFQYWEAEHTACRDNVALFEMCFMSKFLVQGYDAGKFLNWLSTANVDGLVNTITYTQWLNEHGYMEADLTVIKLSDTEFMVVATDTQHNHVWSHMTNRLSRDWHVTVTDVTSRYAQINLQGPKSRDLLQSVTSRDLSTGFDFRTADEIDIGLGRALCTRITYVGELGYELFIPTEHATVVYDEIVRAGTDFGLQHAGLKALGSLRLEKGYRDYGHDMDNTDTIWDTGLSFTIDWDKSGGFIGMDHVLSQKQENKDRGGRLKRMANVLVPLGESDPLLYHGEVLWRNDTERISDVRAGSYGFTVGGGVGLTMLESPDNQQPITKSWIADSTWHVEIADKLYPCQVSLSPFYDPKNKKIKPELNKD